MVVLAPQFLAEPEVDHFAEVEGTKGVDIDVLPLMENQMSGYRKPLQGVIEAFDVDGFDVPIVEAVNHQDVTLDVFKVDPIIAGGPETVIGAALPVFRSLHGLEVALVQLLNPTIISSPLGAAKAFGG